ncbi:glycosyl transferase [Oceaniferula spumae]|uniref:TIGR04283 family arsenosugar biosynthesis glycosyltransferase n=1 Tax=Oceaniferula spumae TaxID=2979115 RepID=UPI003A67B640
MPSPSTFPKLSIIIPVLNEGVVLRSCLEKLPLTADPSSEIEVIISDGGSQDDTVEIARDFPVTIIYSPAGRAEQMNAGANAARGKTLLFLHADTILPASGCESVIASIESGFSMGCFDRKFSGTSSILKKTSVWAGWRVRKAFWAYGDQAMFIRHDVFVHVGGFKPLPRFEDLDLAIRAKRHGTWTVLPGPVISDGRRFKNGTLRRVIGDFLLTVGWLTGIVRK